MPVSTSTPTRTPTVGDYWTDGVSLFLVQGRADKLHPIRYDLQNQVTYGVIEVLNADLKVEPWEFVRAADDG